MNPTALRPSQAPEPMQPPQAGPDAAPANPPDDWLRCAMAHWLASDAPGAFAWMRDGQPGLGR